MLYRQGLHHKEHGVVDNGLHHREHGVVDNGLHHRVHGGIENGLHHREHGGVNRDYKTMSRSILRLIKTMSTLLVNIKFMSRLVANNNNFHNLTF